MNHPPRPVRVRYTSYPLRVDPLRLPIWKLQNLAPVYILYMGRTCLWVEVAHSSRPSVHFFPISVREYNLDDSSVLRDSSHWPIFELNIRASGGWYWFHAQPNLRKEYCGFSQIDRSHIFNICLSILFLTTMLARFRFRSALSAFLDVSKSSHAPTSRSSKYFLSCSSFVLSRSSFSVLAFWRAIVDRSFADLRSESIFRLVIVALRASSSRLWSLSAQPFPLARRELVSELLI